MLTFDEAVDTVLGEAVPRTREWLEKNKELLNEVAINSKIQQLLLAQTADVYRLVKQQDIVIVPMNRALEMVSNLMAIFATGMMIGREMEKTDLEKTFNPGGDK